MSTGHPVGMWADDPWIREHSDAARQLAGQSLAHRLDDIINRAQRLGHEATQPWWEALAAHRAHAETERILARLSTFQQNVWRAVG